MISLSRIVGVGVVDLSYDTVARVLSDLSISQRLIHQLTHLFRSFLLLRRVSENHRGVLRASIVTLSVDRGRVMESVEEFDELFIIDLFVVKEDVGYLNIACLR